MCLKFLHRISVKILLDSWIFLETGFQYKGFCFYLGGAGDNCDNVCKSHGAANEAAAAANVIVEEDCTMIDHFADTLGIQLTPASNNPYWHFGY